MKRQSLNKERHQNGRESPPPSRKKQPLSLERKALGRLRQSPSGVIQSQGWVRLQENLEGQLQSRERQSQSKEMQPLCRKGHLLGTEKQSLSRGKLPQRTRKQPLREEREERHPLGRKRQPACIGRHLQSREKQPQSMERQTLGRKRQPQSMKRLLQSRQRHPKSRGRQMISKKRQTQNRMKPVTEHGNTTVKYEQYESENEQWQTATEQWETDREEGTTDTHDIHPLIAQKMDRERDTEETANQSRRETLSEDSEEWETASDDSIDRPVLVQNEETVDWVIREVREIMREREVEDSEDLNTISHGIQTASLTSHEVTDTIREGETVVDKRTSVNESETGETGGTLAMNNEDNVLETIRDGTTETGTEGSVTQPEERQQETEGTAVKIGEQWDLLEERKDTSAEIMAPSKTTERQESEMEKLEQEEIPEESQEDGIVIERGLCNLLGTDTRVQGQGLLETDTGVQGQGLIETDTGVQGQGLIETDTGVQGQGLTETDTGVQGQGLLETDTGIQGQGLLETDTGVQGQGLIETDTGVQGQGLIETDTGVQGQGLIETDTVVQVQGLLETDTGVQGQGLMETDTGVQGQGLTETDTGIQGQGLLETDTGVQGQGLLETDKGVQGQGLIWTDAEVQGQGLLETDTGVQGQGLLEIDTGVKGQGLLETDTGVQGQGLLEIDTGVKGQGLLKTDTGVQVQGLMETDTGVQGQGLLGTDTGVQGQGLLETDTEVQGQGLLETDTGVQGQGLMEQEITCQFGDVTKQSLDHKSAEKVHLTQEITVTEEEESEAQQPVDGISDSPQAMMEAVDHETHCHIPVELSLSCELQDPMRGVINLDHIYGEPSSTFDFQPFETQRSQSLCSDVFSPTYSDQTEPEGYEQNEMPQLGDKAHQYNDQYQEEKGLCPAVLTRSVLCSTDPNKDGNYDIVEGSQGVGCNAVKETPSALGILQEAAGSVEISLEKTEGSDSQNTGRYLSEQAMDKGETDSITDTGTAMENETQGMTRQWSTTESLGTAECSIMQSEPYDEGSLQKTRIASLIPLVSLTPPEDKEECSPEITRETVILSAYSPHVGQERDNIIASDERNAQNKKTNFYPIQISNPILNLSGSPEHLGFYSEGLDNSEGNTCMDLPGNQPGMNFGASHHSPVPKRPLRPQNPVWVAPRQIRYSEDPARVYKTNEQRESFLIRRSTIRYKKGTYQGTGNVKKRRSVFIPPPVDEQEPTRDSGKSGQSTIPTFSAINILRPGSPQSILSFRPESQAIFENEQSDDNSGQENLADEEEPIKKESPSRRSDSVVLREKHHDKTPELSQRLRRNSKFYGASRVLYQEYSDEALNQAIKNQTPESPRLRRRESQDSYLQRLSMSSADSLWQDIPEIRGSVGFLSMSRDEQKLQEAKFELIMSEALYLRSLNIAVDHFQYNPDLQEVLTAQDRQWLFSRLSEVRDASSEFLFDLEDEFQRNKYNFQVCKTVIDHEPNFRRVYLPYVTNQSYQERTFQRLLNNNPRFQLVLSRLESDPMCQRLGLKSFLILPFQRIIRLRLLLQNILKRSAPGSVDELQATQAHNAVEKLIRDCNESVQRMKDTEELILLNQKIQFECKIFPLISQSRRLIKHSEVSALEMNSISFKLKITRAVYLHLFNDCLLLSRTREGGRFLVFDYAHAADVRVERCEKRIHGNQKNIFCISLAENAAGSPDGRRAEYFFRTDTQSQKLRWISALSPPKEEPDLFKYHGLSQMLCLKSYKARENDELSLEKADIIFVKQRSEDGWLQGVRLSDMQSGWFPMSHVQPVSRNACLRNLEEEQRLQTARAKLQLPPSN
ncbi:uncharacterized protein LOC108695696 isoform X2 [Xenopus laevis]|uniref:Uncharacterized protein LOC108695696 isoform X2 n=1 Tax=Xenopus laevis TaxID=8355 RepID=A0A8J1L923_XENLA|nr:uncharacterized protein LOC108695696 isoform X2 [Xenopus laevis]